MKTTKLILLFVLLALSFNSFAGWDTSKSYSLVTYGMNRFDNGIYQFSSVGVISTVEVRATTFFYAPANSGGFSISEGWAKLYEDSYGPYAAASARAEASWDGTGSNPGEITNQNADKSTQIVNTVRYSVSLKSNPYTFVMFRITIK